MKKNLNILTREWVQKAYKKLKSYLYFDKTQLPRYGAGEIGRTGSDQDEGWAQPHHSDGLY